MFGLTNVFLLATAASSSVSASLTCSWANSTYPTVYGAKILHFTATEVRNYSATVEVDGASLNGAAAANLTNLDFCSVNITYTHPGWNDTITVTTWLPLYNWNGRFQGTGGSGWDTDSGETFMAPAVVAGYAASMTDGGHPDALPHPTWGLSSPGNVNYFLLQDFASVALSDMTLFGQAITKTFYGRPAAHSYWNGCSTGGRQGLMLAQRYPELYDGILALAPAINWDSFINAEYWAQHVMNRIDYYPPDCELDAFTRAAIAACDGLDGVVDGIVSDEDACDFDPRSVIGQTFLCNGTEPMTLTAAGAEIALAAWTGPVDRSGKRQWFGLNRSANLTSGLVGTTTTTTNGTRTGAPFPISTDWITYFIEKDTSFDVTNITDAEYFRILHRSRNEYAGIINTADPDLSTFAERKGKMITWHGLSDQLIFPAGTRDYYERVLQQIPTAHEFYRFFEAPGVQHCAPGNGPYPVDVLESLVQWVEHGSAPEVLGTVNITASGTGDGARSRDLCPWPEVQEYVGGDTTSRGSFKCVLS